MLLSLVLSFKYCKLAWKTTFPNFYISGFLHSAFLLCNVHVSVRIFINVGLDLFTVLFRAKDKQEFPSRAEHYCDIVSEPSKNEQILHSNIQRDSFQTRHRSSHVHAYTHRKRSTLFCFCQARFRFEILF